MLARTRPEFAARYREIAGELLVGTAAALAEPAKARALARATACLHRSPSTSCVCSGACALGHGLGGYASLDDCASCPDWTARDRPIS